MARYCAEGHLLDSTCTHELVPGTGIAPSRAVRGAREQKVTPERGMEQNILATFAVPDVRRLTGPAPCAGTSLPVVAVKRYAKARMARVPGRRVAAVSGSLKMRQFERVTRISEDWIAKLSRSRWLVRAF